MAQRRSIALGSAALATMLAAGCTQAGTIGRAAPREGGPLVVPAAHGSLVRGPVGTRITDGLDIFDLGGSQDATVVSVRSVGGEAGLRFLGARLAGPERKQAGWSQLEGFPPQQPGLGELVDAEGATIAPRSETRKRLGHELLLGYEVIDDQQVVWRSGIEVVYRVAGTEYLWRSPSMLVYCPRGLTADECFERAGDPPV